MTAKCLCVRSRNTVELMNGIGLTSLVAEPLAAAAEAAAARDRQLVRALRVAVSLVPVQSDCTTCRFMLS